MTRATLLNRQQQSLSLVSSILAETSWVRIYLSHEMSAMELAQALWHLERIESIVAQLERLEGLHN